MASQILLPNGCKMSTPSVNPSNWLTGGKTLIAKYWQIQYYFYTPNSKKGKLIVVKNMNEFKDLKTRRAITTALIEDEIYNNKRGYNPVKKKFVAISDQSGNQVHEDLNFIDAFRMAAKKDRYSDDMKQEFRWMIDRFESVVRALRLDRTTIYTLKRRDLKAVLESINPGDVYYNRMIAYCSSLLSELVEDECCETNIARDLRKRKIIKKPRKILNEDEYFAVMKHLKAKNYHFWRYAMIFGHSGARSTELRRLKSKDVDLVNQEYTVTIQKGKQHKVVTKVILKCVLHLWKEVMAEASEDDYIFARFFKPGTVKMQKDSTTKFWYRNVKKSKTILNHEGQSYSIESDFYALKHYLLDSLPVEYARLLANHDSDRTTKIYQVRADDREREKLKNMDISMVRKIS